MAFRDLLNDLLEIVDLNTELCPWFSSSSSEDFFNELKGEIKEVENFYSRKNLEEELGDVLWDYLMLIQKLEDEKKIKRENVISEIIDKIKRRKPYLLTGEKVTLETAHKIWIEEKKREKSLENTKD